MLVLTNNRSGVGHIDELLFGLSTFGLQFGRNGEAVLFAAGEQRVDVIGQTKLARFCDIEMVLSNDHRDVVLVSEDAFMQFDCSEKRESFLKRTKIVQTEIDLVQIRVVEAQVQLVVQLVVDKLHEQVVPAGGR